MFDIKKIKKKNYRALSEPKITIKKKSRLVIQNEKKNNGSSIRNTSKKCSVNLIRSTTLRSNEYLLIN